MEKPSASDTPEPETRNIIDDTSLLALVTIIYAFVHMMAGLNIDPCSC